MPEVSPRRLRRLSLSTHDSIEFLVAILNFLIDLRLFLSVSDKPYKKAKLAFLLKFSKDNA